MRRLARQSREDPDDPRPDRTTFAFPVFNYRVDGKQRWESCRTIDKARRLKIARATNIERGEFEPRSRVHIARVRP